MYRVVWALVVWFSLAMGAATAQVPSETLPRDLSALGMFRSADLVVKAVILGLAFASILSWTIALAKAREVLMARLGLRRGLLGIKGARTLEEAKSNVQVPGPIPLMLTEAQDEINLTRTIEDREGLKERIASRLERIEAGFARTMSRGTGLLATIGATAPFVGLFGTVWGIMNSFIGISKLQTTNLAIVAPGIAEALLATAAGLVVAIPAVVIYNGFSRLIGSNRALCADATACVMRIASRDIGAANPAAAPQQRRAQPSIAEVGR